MMLIQDTTTKATVQVLADAVREEWQTIVAMAPRALLAVLVLVLTVIGGKIVGRIVGALLERGRLRPIQREFFLRVVVWIVYLIGLAVILNVLGLRTVAAGLMAGGGITAIILGFAFRQIGENFMAGLFLAFSAPFRVGDLIESAGLKGTVRSIALRDTHIRTADGLDIYIPNAQIVNEPLINYTRDGNLRPEFTIGIDYGDDALAACRLLYDTVVAVPGVAPEPAPSITIKSFEGAWVQLEVAFWINVFEEGISLAAIKTEVMDCCRRALRDGEYTLSCDTVTAIDVAGRRPLEVEVETKA